MDGKFQVRIEALLKKGEGMLLSSPLREVHPILDKVYRQARDSEYTAGRFRAAYLLAWYYFQAGNITTAYTYSSEALELSREVSDHVRYIKAAWLHGSICCGFNRFKEAEDISNSAISYATQYRDKISHGLLLTTTAYILLKDGKGQEAHEVLLKSERLFKDYTTSESYGFILSAWCNYFRTQNNIELIREYAGKAIENFSRQNNCFHEMTERVGLLINLYLVPSFNKDEIISELQQLEKKAHEYGYYGIEFAISTNLGILHQRQGELSGSLDYYENALKLAREKQVSRSVAPIYRGIAIVYRQRGNFDISLSYLRQAISACEEGDEIERAEILLLLSYVLLELNDVEAAESAYNQVAALITTVDYLTNFKLVAAVCHGKIHAARGNYEIAERSLLNALDIAKGFHNPSLEGSALLCIAELYLSIHENSKAGKYFEKLLSLARDSRARALELDALLGLAIATRNTRPSEAIGLFLQVYDMASELSVRPEIMKASENLSELFLAEQKLQEAFHYFRIFHETRNSIHNDNNASELKKIDSLFSVVPLEQMYRKEKEKVKALEAELENKSKEAVLLSLQLTQKDKILQDIKLRVTDIQRSKGQLPEINEILKVLHRDSSSPAASKAFKDHVMNAQPEFIQKLLDISKQLTPTEVKICSLLRMNLTSKEISKILNVSSNNIEIHRVHIRKKLALPRKTSLLSFLGRV